MLLPRCSKLLLTLTHVRSEPACGGASTLPEDAPSDPSVYPLCFYTLPGVSQLLLAPGPLHCSFCSRRPPPLRLWLLQWFPQGEGGRGAVPAAADSLKNS